MIENLKKELFELTDAKYQAFSSSLLPETNNILGVRLPILRKMAKKIVANNYWIDFLKENDDSYFELTMLEGMIISYLEENQQIKYLEKFIPKINNWSICDSFCCGLKCFKNNKNKDLLEKYFKSDKEFELRFAFVILLNYFIEDDFEYVIQKINEFNSEKYYAKMAAAWCLSICIIKNYNQTLLNIKNNKIHPWVTQKGLTKAIESLRLNKNQKEELKILRQNYLLLLKSK